MVTLSVLSVGTGENYRRRAAAASAGFVHPACADVDTVSLSLALYGSYGVPKAPIELVNGARCRPVLECYLTAAGRSRDPVKVSVLGISMRRLIAAVAGAGVAAIVATASAAVPNDPPLPARVPGIDVSRFQETVDWPAVADDGVRFAFVQASRGSGSDCTTAAASCGLDGYYAINYAGARTAGIPVGPYHRAFVGGRGVPGVKADARAEARLFSSVVGELVPGDLRPALDIESPLGNLNPYELRLWAKTWLRSVRRRLGVMPIIYTNASTWNAIGNPTSFALRGHLLWVANWNVTVPQVPAEDWAGRGWRIWQYSSSGHVDGISGRVDLDWLRGGWSGISIDG